MNLKTKLLHCFIIVAGAFLLSNCQTEEVATERVPVSISHSRRIKFDEFARKTGAMEKFKGIANRPKPGANNRLVYNEAYDFSVETSEIVMIENGNYDSYTFAVYRDYETSYVENLVLSKTEDGSYSASLIKYNFTQEEREDIENHEMHGMKAQLKTLSLDNERFNPNELFSARPTTFCRKWVWDACDYVGTQHFAGPKCTQINGTIDITICYNTEQEYDDYSWIAPDVPVSGSNGGGGAPNEEPILTEPVLLNTRSFERGLSINQKAWWNDTDNREAMLAIAAYMSENNENGIVDEDAKQFAKELIDLALLEPNEEDARKLVQLTLLIERSGNNFFTDEFAESLMPFLDINAEVANDPHFPGYLSLKTYLNYKKLRVLNPEWSRSKCLWYATKEIIHVGLDVFGLIPVGGEIADIVNGVLYTIEGDGINATLSYASAIPLVGYGSIATKYSLKVITSPSGNFTKLVWKVTANGVDFGNRNQLRAVLGMIRNNGMVAHHIIPWAKGTHPAIQKAAKSGRSFHMNEALNGIPLDNTIHFGSHSHYDNLVQEYLDAIPLNATPQQAYDAVNTLINRIRTAVQNNPNVPINQLNF